MFDRWHLAKALFIPAFLLASGCQSLQTQLSDEPAEVIAKDQLAEQSLSANDSVPNLARNPDAPVDLWARIRQSYSLDTQEHERIEQELKRYAGKNGFFRRIAERADPYLFLIVEEMERNGIPGEVALLPIVESAFKPFAYSHGRASGLWQFISATGLRYGMKQSWWYDGRRDVLASTQGAAKYLTTLRDHFDGDWLLALAAYNSGEYKVLREMKKNRAAGKPTDFWNLDLPQETEAYVPRLLAIARIIADPAKHGIKLPPITNEPKLAAVETGGQLDLAIAADMAGITLDELYQLNPGFNRWATDPDGPHRLLVPLASKERFSSALARMPKAKRVQWARHKIRQGEALSLIAKRYRTTSDAIRKINKMKDDRIRAGNYLLVPVSVKNTHAYALSEVELQRTRRLKPDTGYKTVYTVRNGDNLWNIARKFKVSHKQLASWNGINTSDLLKVGSKLTVWHEPPKTKTAANGESNKRFMQKVRYRVREGDSLARIAQRFRVSLDEIQRWNPQQSGKFIHPGQTISLRVDVSRTSGTI